MGIDMSKMRDKLETLKTGRSKDGRFKPKKGEKQIVRFLPAADGDPFKEYHFHWNVGSENRIFCLKKNLGKECPICTFASSLWSDYEKNQDPDDREMAISLFSKERYYSIVMLRDETDPKPYIYDYTQKVYKQLLDAVIDPDYGDITDPETGFDVTVNYYQPEGSKYPTTELRPRRNPQPIFEDSEKTATFLEELPDIEATFDIKTEDEIIGILDAYLKVSAGADEATDGTEKVFVEKKEAASTSDIDAAFAELEKTI